VLEGPRDIISALGYTQEFEQIQTRRSPAGEGIMLLRDWVPLSSQCHSRYGSTTRDRTQGAGVSAATTGTSTCFLHSNVWAQLLLFAATLSSQNDPRKSHLTER